MTAMALAGTIRAEVGTDVPLDVSAGLLAEVGPRIRLRAAVGILPKAYLDASNDAAQALFVGYSDPYRALVEAGLDGATVVRVHTGWRPFRKQGLYGHFGGSYVSAQGAATGSDVAAVTRTPLPSGARRVQMEAREELLLADVELGWEESLGGSPLTLRVGLGWSFTMAARASLRVSDLPAGARARAGEWTDAGEVQMEQATTSFVHPPVVSAALGWVFGRRERGA